MIFRSLLALCAFASVADARPTLDKERLARLAKYDVLEFSDPFKNGLERGKAIGVFDATPEEVFRVATDYAKWKEYMPRVSGSQVTDRDRSGATVEIVADLPWPAGRALVKARYQHERLRGEIYRVKFWKLAGTMKEYLGSLYIEPFARGKAALTYELVAMPDILAPRSAVNKIIRRSAAGFVHALRQRINDLHTLGLLHPEPLPPTRHRSPLVGPPPAEREVKADAKQ
jgi:hypothetical protein